MIPWSIKFLFGGLVDYFIKFGRKRFILMGGIISSVSLFSLVFIDPAVALIPFALLLFIGHCGVGFLDVSADAWAIETSREQERGKINGAMYGGLFAGMAIGNTLLAFIAQIFGFAATFLTTGLIILLIIIFPLIIKEVKTVKKRQKIASMLVGEFKKRTTQLVAIYAPISAISEGILTFTLPVYMSIGLQLEIAQIGLISAIFPLTTVVGSLIGGAMADRWGRKITLFIFIAVSIFFSASLIFASTWQILAIILGLVGFLRGGYYSSSMAICMDITNPKIGATQFSILTATFNVGEMSGEMMSGSLVAMLGFSRVFLFSGWIFGPALLILYFIRFKKPLKKT